ncbi:MAG: dTDP-glucose 4,6-dehydratase [Nitrospirae bacterium]|nr:dTDP-glucose 4,6-dehydratase [Nitrospirota bacterium]
MRILITGGAGFIGSNLILHWFKHHPDDIILNLDNLTYAANIDFLNPVTSNPNYRFIQADIVDRNHLKDVLREFIPQGVIHLAAESHVDNSIKGPEIFVLTNVLGTFNLLEECRQLWNKDKLTFKENRFLHISTDEVFGSLESGSFSEQTPYRPNSPYSATKAGSDHIVRAYHYTYGMNAIITNCSNNFGPNQNNEKLIPTVIRSAISRDKIPVYGNGQNIRDWLFVEDHCNALDMVFHKGKSGETYNIGGRNQWKNIDLVNKICDLLSDILQYNVKEQISNVTDRLGHDLRYAVDSTKIERELKWRPAKDFDTNLKTTIDWYLKKREHSPLTQQII